MYKLLGETLKKLRLKDNKTHQNMADMLNITRPAYGNYESNDREPNIETLIKLADYYEVSMDDLFGRNFENSALHWKERALAAENKLKDIQKIIQ
jgi:transcriptional regulator with XRE-family HTH domain